MDYFSSALRYEYSDKGIIVQVGSCELYMMTSCSFYSLQSVLPFFVATKLSGIQQPSFAAPTPKKFVCDALATIGIQNRTFGTLSHVLQVSSVYGVCTWHNYIHHHFGRSCWFVDAQHLGTS